ncbi:MAG: GNAT family N-acetyltransferase [Eubacteriaceae bacterium]|nr:GNAT family N-acetyltransferase [Eubacteriaceae bacterium]
MRIKELRKIEEALPLAMEVYMKLGFEKMGDICESDGIKYVPMKYKR